MIRDLCITSISVAKAHTDFGNRSFGTQSLQARSGPGLGLVILRIQRIMHALKILLRHLNRSIISALTDSMLSWGLMQER
jgi:hypothetical protein